VFENEGRRRKEKKLVKEGLGPWHGRATTGTGRATTGTGRATTSTGRANSLEKWLVFG